MSLVNVGAALMLRESELTGAKLAEAIRELKAHPERRRQMEKRAGLLGRPEASKELADVCVDLMVQTWGQNGRERPQRRSGAEVRK